MAYLPKNIALDKCSCIVEVYKQQSIFPNKLHNTKMQNNQDLTVQPSELR